MSSFSNSFQNIPNYGGTDIRYFTPQPGEVNVGAQCAKLVAMDLGNMEDVLNYLGINPEE